MKKSSPVEIVVYFPRTENEKIELARRVATVHADFVSQKIQKLNCSASRKLELLDSIIFAKKRKDID